MTGSVRRSAGSRRFGALAARGAAILGPVLAGVLAALACELARRQLLEPRDGPGQLPDDEETLRWSVSSY